MSKLMYPTNTDQPENKIEIVPGNETFPTLSGLFKTNASPPEARYIEADYKLKNKLLSQQKTKDAYQYEIERKKLDLENIKLDYENQKTVQDRKERRIQFFTIIFLIIFFVIIFCLSFSLLIYFGKHEIIIEIIKANPFSSIFYFFTSLLGLAGARTWIKQLSEKRKENSE